MKNLPMQSNSKYKQNLLETNSGIGYTGQKKQIRLMSSYEFKAVEKIIQLYKINRITGWSSEEILINYQSSIDGKVHRYFIDFMIETDKSVFLIEVKPYSKTLKPKLKNNYTDKQKRSYEKSLQEWIINYDKWRAASDYCKEMNLTSDKKFEFKIWTEKTLRI